jgi:hypothetical protein
LRQALRRDFDEPLYLSGSAQREPGGHVGVFVAGKLQVAALLGPDIAAKN